MIISLNLRQIWKYTCMRHSKIYLFSINGNVASDKIVDIYKMKHTELG